ncbi:MAG: HEPN domain-containing protein [Candidatus Omnitrophica bacterium]|nr:HEPN domain-containing protein [Candidatus Omnitrophota bacterium]
MQKTIQEWIEISEYDLKTAEAMLSAARYLYVAFMCQQALEKILKAFYVMKKNELPPRTHNLLYLVDILEIDLGDKKLELLSQLNQFYLESRYPGERIQLAKEVDKNKAIEILEKTKEAWKCLRQKLR